MKKKIAKGAPAKLNLKKEKNSNSLNTNNHGIDENAILEKLLLKLNGGNNELKVKIKKNIQKFILPTINKIESSLKLNKKESRYFQILKNNFNNITNELGINIDFLSDKLSERELEIVNFIINDYRNKEISDTLNISIATIERHRYNIRRKFNIINECCNLKTFLKKKAGNEL